MSLIMNINTTKLVMTDKRTDIILSYTSHSNGAIIMMFYGAVIIKQIKISLHTNTVLYKHNNYLHNTHVGHWSSK